MGETTINPEDMEEALLKALQSLFPSLNRTTGGARQEFYDKFQREASERDRDLTERYESDLDTTLIFAGLFSAVTSAFIVAIQTNLQPDYTQLSYGLLQIIANNTNTSHVQTGPFATFPQWTGPSPDTVRVQATLYASLAATLLAAFLAMLGKQWLKRYSQTEMRGSVIDRCRYRRRKMEGLEAWHFDLVMECLPLMLQAGLLLLGYALSDYLFSINKVIASVTIGFTAFGALFYLLIVLAAILFYNCPFQTPFSRIFRFAFGLDNERKKKRGPNYSSLGDHIELPMTDALPPTPFFDKETDFGEYVLDSKCIARMFQMSTDADASMAIMRFIPEIIWHVDIQTTPLEKLYDTVLECFDQSSGHPVVIPRFKEKAYLSAKALVHLAIQRKCIGNDSDKVAFESISNHRLIMGSEDCKGQSDLESTLGIIDRVFSVPGPMPPEPTPPKPMQWANFSFTDEHRAWMGHILLYRAWDAIRKRQSLPDDTKEFVLHSLRLEHPPPAPVIADCLFIIGLTFGIELCIYDLLVVDKSREVNPQIDRILDKVTEIFKNPTHTTEEIYRALEAMELIDPLCEGDIAQKIHNLFRIVVGASVFDPINPSFVRCLRCAYKNNKPLELRKTALFFLPLVGDKIFNTPKPIIEPDEMKSFCADWASTVDSLELIPNVQKAALTVLLGMINSPHWRPHIVPEKWQLLKYFTSVPDNSQPFRRCIDNQDLIEVVWDMDNPAPSFLWLMILWLKYEELIPEVRTQLENVTRKVGKGRRRMDLDVYLAGMDSESHQAARSALSALKGG